ncbi:nuclear transport factor 2 family protein [Aquimarina brevivitae]|uniref:Ketosteroid isomerase-like protein n=1 Tax=Aquimarina brevivitae TaxID=323412 RepID=A0A4Q7P1G4_9FLAO|nr:nuclear transport factor 2 family protein [Aquimarina brevivitae]RZS93686.1 hypothetical protein EV197_2266 [Aquimarina brevivitae]
MNSKQEIAQLYLQYLQEANLTEILSLCSEDAKIISPLYGERKATEFYRNLFKDTVSSELKLDGVFEEKNSNRFTLVFDYRWTMRNKEIVDFKVVDLIVLDKNNKIKELQIIYDTVRSREILKSLPS